ncbi:ribbon-helix-helix protein, CopG family [Rhodoferax sp. 4810]|uniref:Ribbon-helix-helix protein, CopG family n=1 Tax=Thiospirillum jenense TaxID=1653858 RepID=A0A839HF80_9GAMM|nr:ribbon-helix-helix protein, CopG family [Thiospirillum jenense]MBB1076168.1 ribbon-helix-helix protein, CopG family [Rhodoferax jenense]MBB1126046.1 ribbon-helix-helix protein, CopG family [Thiospirillum jenense]
MAQKTQSLTVRLTPELKDALRQIALRERRSMANMLEVMIAEWLQSQAPRAMRARVTK